MPAKVSTPVLLMLNVVVLAIDILPGTVSEPLSVNVAVLLVPKVMDAAYAVSDDDMVGWFVNEVLPMLTASFIVGTPDGDQLLAVFQSVLDEPFQT
ncbi:MAG TPA: hypothetical protein VHB54_03375 [Mucilaginibacter sp.]|nr:hypothetical protein [Mucilaginibacter sp.]